MNRNVSLRTVLIVVALFAVVFGFRFWATGKAGEVHGPQQMTIAPDGTLYLAAGDHLLGLDAQGREVTDQPLGPFDAPFFNTDFAFFANGDLLLRSGVPRPGFLDLNGSAKAAYGLFRCSVGTAVCTRFGKEAGSFMPGYRLFIDHRDDTVYVADAPRNRLLKFDASGHLLAHHDSDFDAPNDMRLYDDGLWVVDTNHLALKRVATDTADFGHVLQTISLNAPQANKSGRIWPFSAVRVNGQWWVVMMQNNMRDGGVFRFDAKGKPLGQLALPVDADPIDLELVGNQVFVSDYTHAALHRFDLSGHGLGDDTDPKLVALFSALDAKRRLYGYLATGALVVFGLLLVVGLAIGAYVERRAPKTLPAPIAKAKGAVTHSTVVPDVAGVYWLRPNREAWRILAGLALLMPMLLLLFAFGMTKDFLHTPDIAFSTLILALLPGMAVYNQYRNRARIGVNGNTVFIERRKKLAAGSGPSVAYGPAWVIVGQLTAFLGTERLPFYHRDDLREHLEPVLKGASELNEWEVGQRVRSSSDFKTVALVFLFALLVLLLVIMAGGAVQ